MPIKITLDLVLAKRGMTGKQLSQEIGLSETQLSLFRSGKVRGIRFATLERLCAVLECRPGDLLDFEP
jgi:putative transcriptional regulator